MKSLLKSHKLATAMLIAAISSLIGNGASAQAPAPAPSLNLNPNQAQTNLPSDGLNTSLGWWSPMVAQPLRLNSTPRQVSLDEIIVRTLEHSTQVKVFSELPMIRRTAIIEADSAFDWTRFLSTRWDDLNDPVGSTLTVGGNGTRYLNEQWVGSGGVRRRNRQGGSIDISQQIGWQRTNSNFFVPNPQGTARLVLGYTQPLLRGRGRIYNESLTVLAKLDTRIANDEFRRQLQSHLLEVTRAYWTLYLERGVLFQKMNSYKRANEIYKMLDRRRSVDAQQSQIVSAKASATTRYAELIRARMSVKNAEARIRALVNDPNLGEFEEIEIIPIDSPNTMVFEAEMREAMEFAIQNRPEILQALKQIKAGQIRFGMTKNELLPQLDLITQAYVAGLRDEGDIGRAFNQQFTTGSPGYSVGLNYEVPIGNRPAGARALRRRLELRQLKSQYATTLQTVKLEVEIAVREITTSQQELVATKQAMEARSAQLDALTKRWEQLPGEDVSSSLALENLLVSQERLADAEFEFLQSQLTYSLATMNLKQTTGLLLRTEGIEIGETVECDLPTFTLTKHETSETSNVVTPIETHVPQDNLMQQEQVYFSPSSNGSEVETTKPAMPTVDPTQFETPKFSRPQLPQLEINSFSNDTSDISILNGQFK